MDLDVPAAETPASGAADAAKDVPGSSERALPLVATENLGGTPDAKSAVQEPGVTAVPAPTSDIRGTDATEGQRTEATVSADDVTSEQDISGSNIDHKPLADASDAPVVEPTPQTEGKQATISPEIAGNKQAQEVTQKSVRKRKGEGVSEGDTKAKVPITIPRTRRQRAEAEAAASAAAKAANTSGGSKRRRR